MMHSQDPRFAAARRDAAPATSGRRCGRGFTWAGVLVAGMLAAIGTLAIAGSVSAADSAGDSHDSTLVWTLEQVAQMAAAHSPTAKLLESERSAVACGLDRDSEEECARVGLIQAVYRDMVQHQRTGAAADAERAYYRTVAAERQLDLLRQAAPLLDALESLAATAARLDLPDGDRGLLDDQRLEMEDRWIQADFAQRRLHLQLSELSGQSLATVAEARLSTPLPEASGIQVVTDQEIATALQQRGDLRALETLCRCLSPASLPAARQLLGWLSPGLGNVPPSLPAGARLFTLHASPDSWADLACRRSQCQQLVAARRDQIRAEVRDAVLQLELAIARAEVAMRRVASQRAAVQQTTQAVEFEQSPPGTDTRAKLALIEQQSALVERQLAIGEAWVRLGEVTGAAPRGAP